MEFYDDIRRILLHFVLLLFIASTLLSQPAEACEGPTIFACKYSADAQSIFDDAINPETQEKSRQKFIKTGMCKNICRNNVKLSGSKGLFVIYEDSARNKWFVR